MSILQQANSSEETGKKFRLIVRSAEEAVRVIRDKLGDNAKVISVRQVGGEGLKRFISSPKLEVIAQVVEENEEVSEVANQIVTKPSINPDPLQDHPKEKVVTDEPSPKNEKVEVKEADENGNDNYKLLSKFGFDSALLSDIRSWANWSKLEQASIAEVLKEITVGLSDRYRSITETICTEKVALLGGPGVGKTTTLCKFLAHEVFMNKNLPSVLKVENGVPNPDDALRIFCEVVGVTLFRESESIPQVDENHPLYLDFPGFGLSEMDEWTGANQVLDDLGVETRILVVNGAYDREIIKRYIRSSQSVNATHIAITHFDEMTNSTKLWPIILNSNLAPVCICNGQNVTGDFSTSVLNQLIAKTFPEELYSKGFASYQRI